MSNTPQIRFAGFTDAWEQRKLEEVITVGNGMDYKHLSEGDIPVYGTGGYMLSVDKALSYDKDAIGIGRKGTIDKPYVLKAPFWTVDTLFYCIPKEDYSLDFVYCIFQNVNWKEKDESTGVPSLSKVNINSTDVKVPTLAEQEKIGAYFAQLDNLITLHQRKCDALQKFKKSMLQKMFPQNGESVPEIRFAGFTDAWEQRKCSDFIKLVGGATPSKANKDYWDGDIVWLSSQEIKGGFVSKGTYNITQKAVDDNTTKMIPANTPMFISRSGILANSFPITRALCNVAINQDIKALLFDHTVFSNDYIVHYLESKEQFILKSIVKSGTTVQSISIPDFEKMPINIPASKDEQDRIGIYFENLDTLITLHQRKLETLQKMKKSLLQKMFV